MRAVVQLRSEVDMEQGVKDTLEMLNVHTINHCTLVPETDTYRGMITKVNDYVAHGQPSAETVATLLRSRGEPAEGEGSVTDEWVGDHTDYGDVDALAAALVEEETTLQAEGISPALRLHPPRAGHDGIKSPTAEGGQLGTHEADGIDDLLEAMR
jgi:large subunit ribosomal protein L30